MVVVDIISSVLPEDMLDDVPVGFTQVGHVCMFSLYSILF